VSEITDNTNRLYTETEKMNACFIFALVENFQKELNENFIQSFKILMHVDNYPFFDSPAIS